MTTETEPVDTKFKVFDEDKGEWIEIETQERFRRWVQMAGGQWRHFREFGDPRLMDYRTGEFIKKADGSYYRNEDRESVPADVAPYLANEVLWAVTYDPMSEYGMPWFMGLWNDTEADYHASDATRDYLSDGGIPKVVFVFLKSQLTGGSAKAFKAAFEETKGNNAQNRAVLLEAAPLAAKTAGPTGPAAESGAAGFHVVKLNDLQQGDALFREFRKDHEERVRVARRLPGLFIGKDNQANYATASIQVQIGVSQVFAPEQTQFDDMINGSILPELNAVWWRFKSLGPTLEDNATWVAALRIAIEFGAIPDYPTLRQVLSEVFGYKLPSGDEKGVLAEWEKMPPGFVSKLFAAIQGYPQFGDLAAVMPVDENQAADTARAVNRSVKPLPGSVEDRLVDMFVNAAKRAREQLARPAEA